MARLAAGVSGHGRAAPRAATTGASHTHIAAAGQGGAVMAKAPRLAPAASACVMAMALAMAAHAALPAGQGADAPREALASADVSAKFDDGFYDRVQQWIAEAGAAGAAGASGAAGGQGAPNSEPALEVLAGGRPAGSVIDLAPTAGTAGVSLRATDAEGDAVAFSMDVLEATMAPGAAASSPPALADHGNGTATLTVDGSAAGEYLVALSASDAHGEDWGTYLIRVAPAAG